MELPVEYPKIETLFNRDEKFKVIVGDLRLPEFDSIKTWYVTEKIDGTNVRVIYDPHGVDRMVNVVHTGRTSKSQLHPNLMKHLEETYTEEKLKVAFSDLKEGCFATVFCEGYGPKIQSGGNYRPDISTRIYDVFIYDEENPLGGWWLEPENVRDIADKLDMKMVPILDNETTLLEIVYRVASGSLWSEVSIKEHLRGELDPYRAEGVVARTKPLLFTRKGERLMWKLKYKDFPRDKE